MTVTITLSIASEEFPLGAVFEGLATTGVELERIVPTGEALLPYTWVYGEDAETVREAIETSEYVHHVEVLDALPDRTLLRIGWEPTVDGLLTAITEGEATILSADGDADRWRFQLRFPSSDTASRFQQRCREAGIALDVTSVHDSTRPGTARSNEMTAAQRETLERALEQGYFDIPRRTTVVELAAEFGISDQAASERLRRALKRVVTASFK